MQDLYFDKKNFRQRYKDTVNPKNKISSQTSVLSIWYKTYSTEHWATSCFNFPVRDETETYIPPCSLSTMGLVIGCPVGILGPRYVPPLSRVTKPQLTQCPIVCWQQPLLWQIHRRLHSGELEATGKHGLWEEMRKYMYNLYIFFENKTLM